MRDGGGGWEGNLNDESWNSNWEEGEKAGGMVAAFHDLPQMVNHQLILKDTTVSYCFTLFICGGPWQFVLLPHYYSEFLLQNYTGPRKNVHDFFFFFFFFLFISLSKRFPEVTFEWGWRIEQGCWPSHWRTPREALVPKCPWGWHWIPTSLRTTGLWLTPASNLSVEGSKWIFKNLPAFGHDTLSAAPLAARVR